MESNHLPSGYEPPALTDELQPHIPNSAEGYSSPFYHSWGIMGKTMQNRNIRRFIYTVRHNYLTMNNAVVAIAAVIAVSWAWASVGVVQKNYALQREVDDKLRQKQVIELETQSLEYEQKYYRSSEYLTLEVKKRLGLAEPGEKVLVLPTNTPSASSEDEATTNVAVQTKAEVEPTNLQQWVNFLFGGSNHRDA